MRPKPKTCHGCPLFGNGKGFSVLEGDGSSGLLVVAESLGRAEEVDGLPLRPRAPSGGVFQRAVDVSGLSRPSMTLTNVIRCKAEAPYPPEALAQCRQYLDAAIEERKPKFILALGDVPLNELSLTKGAISELRGFVLDSIYGIPMLATYHPSYLARGAFGTLFGVFLHDLRRAHNYSIRGVPPPLETHYDLEGHTISDYLVHLGRHPELPVAYDIETASILGEEEPDDWREKRIIQIQFSSQAGTALVLPFVEPHLDSIDQVLRTSNMKWDWNGRLSDRLALKGAGFTLNGELHDLMNAWSHLQPGFMSGKDESNGDKGVPAKLMSLQSCVSFYFPNEPPWKGMVQREIDVAKVRGGDWQLQSDLVWHTLRYYGARDADLTFRVGEKLFRSLKELGLW